MNTNTTDGYFWIAYEEMSDKRTKGWFLVDSPINVVLLIMGYFAMVRYGPRLMEKREPFKIKGILIVYNICLAVMNALFIKDIFVGASRIGYDYLCQRSTLDYHPEEMRIITANYWFYISKCIEFADTLFFILRKKTDQLSPLHVFHHSTMFPLCWIRTKWFPSGAAARLPILNSFVHVLMYSYYGLSAFGPKVQKYLWWKKYITLTQLTQFVISLSWAVHSLRKGCNHPSWVDWTNIVYMITFLYLFGKFYKKNYTKKIK